MKLRQQTYIQGDLRNFAYKLAVLNMVRVYLPNGILQGKD
jgi:hypothetical protein